MDDRELQLKIDAYSDMLFKLSFLRLQNLQDAEDVVQEVFYQYVKKRPVFQSPEHEKAWFIRVTVNACKDQMKSLFRRRTVSIEELTEEAASIPPEQCEVLDAVLALPAKYRDVIYLHYYEGYSAGF